MYRLDNITALVDWVVKDQFTYLLAWWREVSKEEVLGDVPCKDERRPSIITQTNAGNVSKATARKVFDRRGWSAYMLVPERADTILNRTELTGLYRRTCGLPLLPT